MIIKASLKNCRIIIKDAAQNITVADTLITSCDWKKNIIRIHALSLLNTASVEVLVLIFDGKCLYEYKGKISNTNVANEREIRLYRGKEKEDRDSSRYQLCTSGKIDKIKYGQQEIELRKPMEATAINISAGGVLLQTMSNSFYVKDKIVFNVLLDKQRINLECQVVRVQNNTLWTEEYGCRILSINSQ